MDCPDDVVRRVNVKRRRTSSSSAKSMATPGKKRPARTPLSPLKLSTSNQSPSVGLALSQDDSFFDQYADQLEENCTAVCSPGSEDMFVEKEEAEKDFIDLFSQNSHVVQETPPHDKDSQSGILSLPMSVLDLKSRALEDLKDKQHAEKNEPSSTNEDSCSVSELVNRNILAKACDTGPFYGLPSKVADLFRTHKNIEKLFDWQERCLKCPAVQEKRNLLYSLPTSGGKTLVAEIIMLQEIICYRQVQSFRNHKTL